MLPTGECQDLTGKHGINAPIGKLLYCNHHNKDWISLDSSTHIKSKGKILWQSWYLHGLEGSLEYAYQFQGEDKRTVIMWWRN